MKKNPTGFYVLHNPKLNKGSAFTEAERDRYGLRGLLPAAVSSQKTQVFRAINNVRRKEYDIERYIFLFSLQCRNERLFYRLLMDYIDELMPIIYTPTVGQACQKFAHIFREPRGFYITPDDRGRVREILSNWPEKDVRMIVVTDGQRILGLGDLGANGMGIPIGKLALYTAGAGIHPDQCLPVMLDVGTNNPSLRDDPLYLGIKQDRLEGDEYHSLIEEFVTTVQDVFPRALIQFEDFLTPNAYALLNTYRDRVLCFNDDIQGTAAMVLAGLYSSTRISGHDFSDLRIMFLGAGSAATGMADLIYPALCNAGLSKQEAIQRLYFIDHKGLLVKSRDNLAKHNSVYAQDFPETSFVEAVKLIKPHVLIGATGVSGTFTEEVIRLMAEYNDRPVIFALSNPSSHAECTAQQAYEWTDGRAIFASGSPSEPVHYKDKNFFPGQGNNAYIFPGVGLGAIACQATRIVDDMFLAAANALASAVEPEQLARGSVYPPLKNLRNISLKIACAVAEKAYEKGLAEAPKPENLAEEIKKIMYKPDY